MHGWARERNEEEIRNWRRLRGHLPGAEGRIVFDKFHVARRLSEAVEQVRRKENKILKAAGQGRLAGPRYD